MTIAEAEAMAAFINAHDGRHQRYTAAPRRAPGAEASVLVQGFEPGRGRTVVLYHQIQDYLAVVKQEVHDRKLQQRETQEDMEFEAALLAWEDSGFRPGFQVSSGSCSSGYGSGSPCLRETL